MTASSEPPPSARARRQPVVRAVLLGVLLAVPGAVPRPAAAQTQLCTTPGSGEAWQLVQPPQASLVLARDGSLIGEVGRQKRVSVSIRTLPRYVGQAFVAIEDQRFYKHDGVDVVGLGGAIKDALLGDARGASTITQQLVGNMHPDLVDRTDRSISRKLREQQAARKMERHYTKEQILEAYLNQVHFGHGWCGVEMAARHYFGTPAAELSLPEAATLAAVINGPAIYDPIEHPERARERRNLVLTQMERQGYLTRRQAAAARRQPVTTAPDRGMPGGAPYLVDMVRQAAEQRGVPVTAGGYRIWTTIDPALQRAAREALVGELERIESRPGYPHQPMKDRRKGSTDYLQGAVVALDPMSGDVLALVGGRDYVASPFNRAAHALRQPGSAFKPVVYAAAIRDSIPPNEIVADTAIAIPMDDLSLYEPTNADGAYLGPMTLREALVRSRNPVAVELALRVGMDSVAALAARLGIETPVAPYPSSALGASAVRPLDFVAAYSAFANLGAAVEPRFIDRIEDRAEHPVYTATPQAPSFALDPRVAWIVRDVMRDVVERGTATAVRRVVPARIPVAGKTGTTDDDTDVWFVGMTPELVAGVWLGFDQPKPITSGAAGGTLAAPVWARMVAAYYRGRAAGAWDVPPAGIVAVELDRDTGRPADESTSPERRYTEYFLEGTEPGAEHFDPWRIFQWGPLGP